MKPDRLQMVTRERAERAAALREAAYWHRLARWTVVLLGTLFGASLMAAFSNLMSGDYFWLLASVLVAAVTWTCFPHGLDWYGRRAFHHHKIREITEQMETEEFEACQHAESTLKQ